MEAQSKICRFCGGGDVKNWVGRYYRCNDCLYICTNPLPSDQELADHYKNYHDKNHQASEIKNHQREKSYRQEIAWMKSILDFRQINSVFDYGASGGYFLDALADELDGSSFTLRGDDLSESAIRVLRDKNYYLRLDSVDKSSQDMIILRGVIEHVPDFRELIAKLCRIIRSKGYLFITATPDSSCTVANVYRDRWIQHHYPSHFQHFTSALVDILMAENGLVLEGVTDLYPQSVYRKSADDSDWLGVILRDSEASGHAYWGSMMTRLYRRLD